MTGDDTAVTDELVLRAPAWSQQWVAAARCSGAEIGEALRIATAVGARLPLPGVNTLPRWATLAALARANVTVARVVEAHTDALAILAEAGGLTGRDLGAAADRTWGVFAAEGGPEPLTATRAADGITLSGFKPWCSLGSELDAALVTAHIDGSRQLFRVDLHSAGVHPRPATGWVSRGLPTVVSVGIDFDQVPAAPVGAAGWYLSREGFAWGGMGVAAAWHGASCGVADLLPLQPATDVAALHRGRVDAALHASACVLLEAARRVDSGAAAGARGERLALQVRAVTAATAEAVLHEVGHATGPGPLAFDESHAARVADLTVYVRQHHGERDVVELGRRGP